MRFPLRELDIKAYQSKIKDMIEDEDCHIFIDTNVLGRLFKLNGKARSDFFDWVNSCEHRFHIPNWVVMEYSKHIYGQKQEEYISDLKLAKSVTSNLDQLKRFFYGYVDEDELQGTMYEGDSARLLSDMDEIGEKYSHIFKAVISKKTQHLKKVQKDIDDHLKGMVMDTDLYKVIGNLYFDYQMRLDNDVPPGFRDKGKETNTIGDLIIWNEILAYCKSKSIAKAILITTDEKPDMAYYPQIQVIDGHNVSSEERQKLAHESLVYEFKLATAGSEDFYSINFYTLVSILSDKYTDLAFSFQMVSRDSVNAYATDSLTDSLLDEDILDRLPVDAPAVLPEAPDVLFPYSQDSLSDSSYLDHCQNADLKSFVERLKSHNWYVQNDAVYDLRKLLLENWPDTRNTLEYRDFFFVIGRNLLQSADGNAFEAVRFIRDMSNILNGSPRFLQKAIVDGSLYEVFFDSHGEIRTKDFKARYFSDVVNQAALLIPDNAFDFINSKLGEVEGRFVPNVGSDDWYDFVFDIRQPENDLDNYHTISLAINGTDTSSSFSWPNEFIFANSDEIVYKLSKYYAVPENRIQMRGIPQEMAVLHYIKEEENNDIEGLLNV